MSHRNTINTSKGMESIVPDDQLVFAPAPVKVHQQKAETILIFPFPFLENIFSMLGKQWKKVNSTGLFFFIVCKAISNVVPVIYLI